MKSNLGDVLRRLFWAGSWLAMWAAVLAVAACVLLGIIALFSGARVAEQWFSRGAVFFACYLVLWFLHDLLSRIHRLEDQHASLEERMDREKAEDPDAGPR